MVGESLLTRADIESAFGDLGRAAYEAGKVIDLSVVGGAAIVLLFAARPATRDVDAVVSGDTAFLREAVRRVADKRGWKEDWLNDSVKGFLSARHGEHDEYLLAMKCLAMRMGSPISRDVDDIRLLVRHLGLSTADQVLDIVGGYYPNRLIAPRTQFGIEEIMQSLAREGSGE